MTTQTQKIEQVAMKQGKMGKVWKATKRVAKNAFYTSLIVGGLMLLAPKESAAQDTTKVKTGDEKELVIPEEKIGLYPNFSFQGVFGNPAYFVDLGDWGYNSVNFTTGEKTTVTMQLSKNISGFQLNAANTSGNAWMVNCSYKLLDNLNIGATYKSANTDGVLGIIYRPVHNYTNMTQVSGQYNVTTQTYKVAAETRQQLGAWTVTVSGQLTFDQKQIVNHGVGLQGTVGRFRTSIGLSGINMDTYDVGEQVYLGKGVLPEGGFTMKNGKVVGGWIGVTKLL